MAWNKKSGLGRFVFGLIGIAFHVLFVLGICVVLLDIRGMGWSLGLGQGGGLGSKLEVPRLHLFDKLKPQASEKPPAAPVFTADDNAQDQSIEMVKTCLYSATTNRCTCYGRDQKPMTFVSHELCVAQATGRLQIQVKRTDS